ncbi:type II toxin-antitoxin system HicA family toxin [Aeromonas dhakensis]|nr:hypothetical protein KBAD45_P240 [Aeromonas dhakensis]CAD7543327.1 hypothetical protein KBAD11_P240 [Aeromonas dhakensis]CAD7543373.1 hypothetical protein KBAD59_P290 [Aeromonas dhakensis]CAD7554824.1 hypothetical protein KBAD10_P230 [Aeromonas dhakensis]CAD7554970.1 hypothetical protein KBAD50_P240 [Aeromonas dhakensis]
MQVDYLLSCVYSVCTTKQKEDPLSSKELIKLLENNGWTLERVRGSHHQFRHPDFGYPVTVPHPTKDLKKGTLQRIMKDAQLK